MYQWRGEEKREEEGKKTLRGRNGRKERREREERERERENIFFNKRREKINKIFVLFISLGLQ